MPELLGLAAHIQDGKAAAKVMPWAMSSRRKTRPKPADAEVAAAQAELEAGIVFAD